MADEAVKIEWLAFYPGDVGERASRGYSIEKLLVETVEHRGLSPSWFKVPENQLQSWFAEKCNT